MLTGHFYLWANLIQYDYQLPYLSKPAEVKEYCRKLIEAAGKGGGFLLTAGAFIDEGKPENIGAVMAAAKEYGVY